MVNNVAGLKIKIFADGADINEMKKAYKSGLIKGFTTNPTLLNKAGITDYTAFAKSVLKESLLTGYGPTNFSIAFDKYGASQLVDSTLASATQFTQSHYTDCQTTRVDHGHLCPKKLTYLEEQNFLEQSKSDYAISIQC